jgi:hypothetical protein
MMYLVRIGWFSGFVNECAPVQPGHLAPSHVRALEVRVQEEVEVKGDVLAGVIHSNVHVQLFLAENESVGDAKRAVPHRPGELRVRQTKNGLHIARL